MFYSVNIFIYFIRFLTGIGIGMAMELWRGLRLGISRAMEEHVEWFKNGKR